MHMQKLYFCLMCAFLNSCTTNAHVRATHISRYLVNIQHNTSVPNARRDEIGSTHNLAYANLGHTLAVQTHSHQAESFLGSTSFDIYNPKFWASLPIGNQHHMSTLPLLTHPGAVIDVPEDAPKLHRHFLRASWAADAVGAAAQLDVGGAAVGVADGAAAPSTKPVFVDCPKLEVSLEMELRRRLSSW